MVFWIVLQLQLADVSNKLGNYDDLKLSIIISKYDSIGCSVVDEDVDASLCALLVHFSPVEA